MRLHLREKRGYFYLGFFFENFLFGFYSQIISIFGAVCFVPIFQMKYFDIQILFFEIF